MHLTVAPDLSGTGSHGRRLTRQRRLLIPADFKRVFDKPCRTACLPLTLLSRPSGLPFPRLGLAISKKFLKAAVARNRVKRLIRESFRHHQELLDGLDIVVLARDGIGRVPPGSLRAELDNHWKIHAERCARSSSL